MAAGGAHAQVVPAFHHANAGAVATHQPGAHVRGRLVAARPHRQPGQAGNAGGVELVPGQPPAVALAAGHGLRQAAARGRAQLRLHPQAVDQRALLQRLAGHAALQRFRPVGVVGQAPQVQVLHAQHQRGGRFATGHGADHPAQFAEAGAGAAERLRQGQAEQAVALQQGEVGVGEIAAAVVGLGAFRQLPGERRQQVIERQRRGLRDGHGFRPWHAGARARRPWRGSAGSARGRIPRRR